MENCERCEFSGLAVLPSKYFRGVLDSLCQGCVRTLHDLIDQDISAVVITFSACILSTSERSHTLYELNGFMIGFLCFNGRFIQPVGRLSVGSVN